MSELTVGSRVCLETGLYAQRDGVVVGTGSRPGSFVVEVDFLGRTMTTEVLPSEVSVQGEDRRPIWRDEIDKVVRGNAFRETQRWWQDRLSDSEDGLAAEWRAAEQYRAETEARADRDAARLLAEFDLEYSDEAVAESGLAALEERWKREGEQRFCRHRDHGIDWNLEEAVAARQLRARRAAIREENDDPVGGLFAIATQLSPGFEQGLAEGASEGELAAFCEEIGVEIPVEFTEIYRRHNGSEVFFRGLRLMSLEAVLGTKQMMDRNLRDGSYEQWGDDEWWSTSWVPLLESRETGYDKVCIDCAGCFDGVPGQVIWWFRDTPQRMILAPSLRDWLETLTVGLHARQRWVDDSGIVGDRQELDEALMPGYPRDVEAQARRD